MSLGTVEYHPHTNEPALKEKRTINISPPQKNGSIWMDYSFEFTAIADEVILDRTPIAGEPNGCQWGGYAGLSIRFNQDFMNPEIISSLSEDNDLHGTTGDWLYMGFKGLDGNRIGSLIMIYEETKREGEAWYVTSNAEIPFYFANPGYLFLKPKTLKKGESITLKYRILHMEGDVIKVKLRNKYDHYSNH